MSQAEQPGFVLIRRLADGGLEWIPLEAPPQRVPAAAEAAYALIDRTEYEAPQTLVARRVGENLVIEVQGAEVLVLEGFFATVNVAFHPTTDIAGGGGPFSGAPVTTDSPMLAGYPAGEQVVWSAGNVERASESVVPPTPAGNVSGGSSSPMMWVGLAAGGLGLAALAGGGGGSGGGEDAGGGGGTPPADTVPPQITSSTAAAGIAENSGAGQVVYTASATDAGAVTYSLKAGEDSAAFSINTSTGAVTLTGNPDFETKPTYNFTVVATDAANNSAERAVSLAIANVNDSPPVDTVPPQITSSTTATGIAENSGAGQVVYTATATDAGAVTYSLKAGEDAAAFSINTSTGAVTLTGNPDFEAKPIYNFTVVATDAANNSAELPVSLAITNVNDSPPAITITSGATAAPIDENSGAQQVVYTVIATATGAVTYSLKAGGDAGSFNINSNTGAVRLSADPNHEAKSSYSFTVVATDSASNSAEQPVSLAITDKDEVAPTITSAATATAINENSGAGQVVYTVTSTDTGDISTGSTIYSLKAGVGDAAAFSINPSTGQVTLTANPNDEAKGSYNFTVVATDTAGNSRERAVSLAINDLDESAPTITSSATASPIEEESGAGQVVYTVTSTDSGDVSTGSTSYSLTGADASAFSINSSSGAVTLTANPDDETKGSYSFTVVAADAAGNSSERAVSLNVIDLDEVAPTITSGAVATALEEESGPNQVVYTVTSTDTGDVSTGSTSYSLTGADASAFSINSSSGVVRLIGNPDFETKSSYNFTVVATDTAGNFAERAVSLAINNIVDETPPEVDDVAITSAVGAQNDILNVGDTVRVTVTMSEDTVVDTAGGTPSVELSIGGDPVNASYVSGSGTSSLVFEYTIQAGDNDANGIGIPSNALEANGGSLADAAGNTADLDHGPVSSNSSFVVDTTAPTLSSSSPDDDDDDFPRGDDIVLNFSDDMEAGSGNIVLASEFDTRTIDINDASQVSVSGNQVTVDPTFDLLPGTDYSVQIDSGALTDDAGNAFAGINDSNTLEFTTDETLGLLTLTESAADLGTDARIMLVSGGADAQDPSAPTNPMSITETSFETSMPDAMLDGGGGQTNVVSFTNMPAGFLTSQGLV